MDDPKARQEELYALLGDLCNGTLTPQQLARLDSLLHSDPAVREFYWNYMSLHADLSWRESAAAALAQRAPQMGLADDLASMPRPIRSPVLGFLDRLLDTAREALVTAALSWTVLAVLAAGTLLTFLCVVVILHGFRGNAGANAPQAAQAKAEKESGKAEAVSAEPLSPVPLPPTDAPLPPLGSVARLIGTTDCRWAGDLHSPRLGDDLEPGRQLVLLSGVADIMFQSGVRALLQGPATMEIGPHNSALLRQGKLTVRIDDPYGHGFEVHTPGMKYTDLGNEFGVWVAADGTQEMRVFRGAVQAEASAVLPALWERGAGSENAKSQIPNSEFEVSNARPVATSPSSLAQPLVLIANQAIRIASPRKFERVEADDAHFVRLPPQTDLFPIFSTGAGLDRGGADLHWELTDIGADADFKPQPAVVAQPPPFYVRDGRDTAQWISKSKLLKAVPDGCRWTYRTRFNLTGFDAATACIEGRITADDYVVEIRLNGKEMPLPVGAHSEGLFAKWLRLKIDQGFVSGENTLEIVIENAYARGPFNVMALCVDCKGTARPLSASKAGE
jgi:hypothetical protein